MAVLSRSDLMPPAASQLASSSGIFTDSGSFGMEIIPCMRIRMHHPFVATTADNLHVPFDCQTTNTGNKINLTKLIKNKVKRMGSAIVVFLPSFAKSQAMQDCVTQSAGVI